ncbi:MAG TPA: hypothetical protein EYP90_06725 [Chromatiaceae bacterium]|nr:hypothetical protein [Chromatiaceae bacterium]
MFDIKNQPGRRMMLKFFFRWLSASCLRVLWLCIIGSLLMACNSSQDTPPQDELSKVQLNEDILAFAFKNTPRIYSGLVKINHEILLIDAELERLKGIETTYPRQQKIVAIEKANWKKIQRNLLDELAVVEKDIERIYVTYLVNKQKGKVLIKEKADTILSSINNTLQASTAHTQRLKPNRKKSFIQKFKAKFFG